MENDTEAASPTPNPGNPNSKRPIEELWRDLLNFILVRFPSPRPNTAEEEPPRVNDPPAVLEMVGTTDIFNELASKRVDESRTALSAQLDVLLTFVSLNLLTH
jgi:hypothetical protein